MCGRYTLTSPEDALRALFDYSGPPRNIRARYNAAPSQEMPIVRRRKDGTRSLDMLRWGLIPGWAGDAALKQNLINARADTVASKPSFRTAFRERRCLIPADGFYEWAGEGKTKQPHRIELPGRAPFAFAGLWESWTTENGTTFAQPGATVESFAIVTTDAPPAIAAIHHRMPVILTPALWTAWLDPASSAPVLQDMLAPYGGPLVSYPVSRHVNNVRNDDDTCLAPLAETAAEAAAPVEPPAAPPAAPTRKKKRDDGKQGNLF